MTLPLLVTAYEADLWREDQVGRNLPATGGLGHRPCGGGPVQAAWGQQPDQTRHLLDGAAWSAPRADGAPHRRAHRLPVGRHQVPPGADPSRVGDVAAD